VEVHPAAVVLDRAWHQGQRAAVVLRGGVWQIENRLPVEPLHLVGCLRIHHGGRIRDVHRLREFAQVGQVNVERRFWVQMSLEGGQKEITFALHTETVVSRGWDFDAVDTGCIARTCRRDAAVHYSDARARNRIPGLVHDTSGDLDGIRRGRGHGECDDECGNSARVHPSGPSFSYEG